MTIEDDERVDSDAVEVGEDREEVRWGHEGKRLYGFCLNCAPSDSRKNRPLRCPARKQRGRPRS